MKHKCLLLIALLYSALTFSQTCPEISFVVPLPTEEVVFIYNDPGPDCGDRPTTIDIDGSTYNLGNCDTFSSRYVLSSGSGVVDTDNFEVTYGGLTCEYNDGTLLGLEDHQSILNKVIKIYPSPVLKGNELTVYFSIPLNASLNVYDITGKTVIATKLQFKDENNINISSLESGLFLARFTTEMFTITKKFIVNR